MNWFRDVQNKKSRLGSVIIMTTFGAVFFLGLTSMVTDLGWLYYQKTKLQTAVNAGWKAGYDRMQELGFPLDDVKKTDITNRVKDILLQNGYDSSNITNVQVTFPADKTLDVTDTKTVNLFFARILNINQGTVAASRSDLDVNHAGGICPLAIPFGVVKDLDRSNYSLTMFDINDPNSGFVASQEYILKLGSGNAKGTAETNPEIQLILVKMDNQTDTGFIKAYGAAYWAMRIQRVNVSDDPDDGPFTFPDTKRSGGGTVTPGHEGIEWLLGYHGGSFLFPYKNADVTYTEIPTKLTALGVNFEYVTGEVEIQNLYQAVGNHVLNLDKARPRVAVYANEATQDAAENVLRVAEIPYGTHPHIRGGVYNLGQLTTIGDGEILDGILTSTAYGVSKYSFLYAHHEDFTGFNGGCDYFNRSCYEWDDGGSPADNMKVHDIAKAASETTELCKYCRDYYFGGTSPGWGVEYDENQCFRKTLTVDCFNFNKTYTNDNTVTTPEICEKCLSFYNYSAGAAVVGWPGANTPFTKGSVGNLRTYPTDSDYWNECFDRTHKYSCKKWDQDYKTLNKNASTSTDLCPYCRTYYFYKDTNSWASPKKAIGYVRASCNNYGIRCGERIDAANNAWRDLASYTTIFCTGSSFTHLQCRDVKREWDLATTKGFTDDPSYSVLANKLYNSAGTIIATNGASVLPADSVVIRKPNRLQKMKFTIADTVKGFVSGGGHFFGQCFSGETLALALWQKTIYAGQLTGGNALTNAAYANSPGFRDFNYISFPWGFHKNKTSGETGVFANYSSINGYKTDPFTLADQYDPRCQSHQATAQTGGGSTNCFNSSTIRPAQDGVTLLGSIDTTQKNYLKGNLGTGQFAFMGGHPLNNISERRLFLDNVLYASLAPMNSNASATSAIAGKQKNNYGVIDPDNFVSGGANDYRDRFQYGSNLSIQINDRVITEGGNQSGPTDQAVTYRIQNNSRFVILPITDVAPEDGTNNPQNASATSIYDIQGLDSGANGNYASGAYNFGSAVRVIGFAEFEILDPTEYTRDGSTITSGDTGDLGGFQSGQVRGRFVRYIVRPGEIPLS